MDIAFEIQKAERQKCKRHSCPIPTAGFIFIRSKFSFCASAVLKMPAGALAADTAPRMPGSPLNIIKGINRFTQIKLHYRKNPLIAYLEMVRRHHAEFNQSRLEASTALHLRCAGYLRKEVEEEMQRHSPPPSVHQDDLSPKIGYLRRILDYAFGAQGDIWVIGQKLGKPDVEKFNKEAEVIDYYRKNREQAASQQQSSNQRFRSR